MAKGKNIVELRLENRQYIKDRLHTAVISKS